MEISCLSYSKCVGYSLGDGFQDLKDIPLKFEKIREVYVFKVQEELFFVFPYGVIICWGEQAQVASFIKQISPYLLNAYEAKDIQRDDFMVGQAQSNKLIDNDIIYIQDFSSEILVSISHAIAQSLKLASLELEVSYSINKVTPVSLELSKTGKIKRSKKTISKTRGKLFLLKSKVNLNYSLLDKPEYFWENPEFDHYYQKTMDYCEIPPRILVLNQKVEILDNMLSLLSDEINHRNSTRLEWIIIWLIFIEIIIFFLRDIFHLI